MQDYPHNNPQPDYQYTQLQPEYAQNDQSQYNIGPRKVTFFTLIAKTFLGLVGGTIGSVILLLIFLAAASILQPVLSPTSADPEQISPIFMVIIMAMIFATSLVASLLTPYLLSLTERERYTKIVSSLYQIFIFNIVIFGFTAPIFLTTSTANIEFTAYAAGLHVIFVATASALIMEIVNDPHYPIMGVYTSLLGILVTTAVNLFIFQLMGNTTVILFAVMPITWGSIGFFQAALASIYNWYFQNYGNDFLAASTSYGADYISEEVNTPEAPSNDAYNTEGFEDDEPGDKAGSDFLRS